MRKTVLCAALSLVLALALAACGGRSGGGEPSVTEPPAPAAAAQTAAPAAERARQDGERFTGSIVLEGTAESVALEHAAIPALGLALDYEYESLRREDGDGAARFVSLWDEPAAPENYLALSASPREAEDEADALAEALTQRGLAPVTESWTLTGAGACIRIQALTRADGSVAREMAELYIIPAPDGCRVAEAHFTLESAEGFGRRFAYMIDSLTLSDD